MSAAVIAVLVVTDLRAIDQVLDRARSFRDAGASVMTLQAEGHVDPQACDALARVDGVRAAGAVRVSPDPVVARALPRGPISAYAVTPGLVELLLPAHDGRAGLVLSDSVAQTLGVLPGDDLVLSSGSVAVAGTYPWPDDGRRRGFSFAALTPVARTGLFDECWVDAWPEPTNISSLLRLVVVANAGADVPTVLGRLNSEKGAVFDGSELLRTRSTRHAPQIGVLASLCIGFVSTRVRRVELASARHVGVTAGSQHLGVLIESAAWTAAAAVLVAAAAATTCALGTRIDDAALAANASRVLVPAVVGLLLGAQAGVAVVSGRHLARYVSLR